MDNHASNKARQAPDPPLPDPPLLDLEAFQPYLDATIKSSDRTRSTFLLLITVVVLSTGLSRIVFMPAWQQHRIQNFKVALTCWQAKNCTAKDCASALSYVNHFGIKLFEEKHGGIYKRVKENSPQMDLFKGQYAAFLQKRTEATIFQLPILGISIDINDQWLFCGASFIVILFMLNYSMLREAHNIRRSREEAPNKHALRLIVMNQVLAPSERFQIPKVLRFLISMTPALAYYWIVVSDAATLSIGTELVKQSENLLEFGWETVTAIPITLLCWLCFRRAGEVMEAVDQVRAKLVEDVVSPC